MYGYNNKPIHHLAHNYAGNAVALRCFSDDAVTRPCYPCNKINCCIAQQIVQIQYTYLVIWLSFLVPIWRIGWEHLSVMHLITWQLALLTPSAWLASLSLSLSLSLCHQTNTIILIIIVTIGWLSTHITTNKIGTTDICWHCYLVFPLRLQEYIIIDLWHNFGVYLL